ncbi:MAG TPA: hypothetical protein VIM84_15805 [Gemmatimonadales bacterium]
MAVDLFISHVAGDTLPAADWNDNWERAENSFAVVGPYVVSGLVPSIGTGLSVNVTAGVALIKGYLSKSSFTIGSLTPSTTNHLYLLANGTATSNTTGTAPANSVKLGTATTNATVVTAVGTQRSDGRQGQLTFPLQAANTELRQGLINLNLWPNSGTMPFNLNGGDLTANVGKFSGALQGSGTPFTLKGPVTVSMPSNANYTLTSTEYEQFYIRVNSAVTLTAQRDIVVPSAAGGSWCIRNTTTGGQAIQIIAASGTGIVIANNRQAEVYFGGANVLRRGPDIDPTV